MASNFMRIPREVRDMIYGLCLVYPYELIPFPTRYEVDEDDEDDEVDEARPKPWNALLFVNKEISKEAAIVFYGKNIWRLSDSAAQIADMSNDYEGPPRLWTRHLESMCHITIALDGRAVKQPTIWELGRDKYRKGGYSRFKEGQLFEDIHSDLLDLLADKWTQKLEMLSCIDNLKSLKVDLSNAYCPNAHCRPHKLVIELLDDHVPDPEDLLKGAVLVTGMVTQEESNHAHAAGCLCEHCHGPEDEEQNDDEEDNVREEPYCMASLPSKED